MDEEQTPSPATPEPEEPVGKYVVRPRGGGDRIGPRLPKLNREVLLSRPQRVRLPKGRVRRRDWDAFVELVAAGSSKRAAGAALRISERRWMDELAANPDFRERIDHAEAIRIGAVQDAHYLACTVPDKHGRYDSRAQALFLANALPEEYSLKPGVAPVGALPTSQRIEIHLTSEQREKVSSLVTNLLGIGPDAPAEEKVVEALPAEAAPEVPPPATDAPLAAETLPAPPASGDVEELW